MPTSLCLVAQWTYQATFLFVVLENGVENGWQHTKRVQSPSLSAFLLRVIHTHTHTHTQKCTVRVSVSQFVWRLFLLSFEWHSMSTRTDCHLPELVERLLAVPLWRPSDIHTGKCNFYKFYIYASVLPRSILIISQRNATQSSLFIILKVHSTCFGCQSHPSLGVCRTVTTASGTVQLPPSNMAKVEHVAGR